MKIGRNEPCPCGSGSGKKYKHCCLKAHSPLIQPAEMAWRRLRRALDGHVERMMHFVVDTYGEAALDVAWAEFTLWEEEIFDPESVHMPVFASWLFYCWRPRADDDPFEDPDDTYADETPSSAFAAELLDVIPAQRYLEHRGRRLEPLLRRYIEACLQAPFSFYEIANCRPGHGFQARDVFTAEAFAVREEQGSQHLQDGDLLYAQLVSVDGLTVIEACAPCALPPQCKLPLIEQRDRMAGGAEMALPEAVTDWAGELRDLYLDLTEQVLDPDLPAMQNTDGEDLVMHRLVFDTRQAQATFDALKHLAVGVSEQELLEDALLDDDGRVQRVEIPWLRAGSTQNPAADNTVLGMLTIDAQRLVIEVNSDERARRIRALIEQTMGEQARYRLSEVESGDQMMERVRAAGPPPPRDEELANTPEVQAALAELLARHYDKWPEESLPALGGRTPLEAVKDPAGREKVEALLRQFERGPQPLDAEVMRRLRQRLGLVEAP